MKNYLIALLCTLVVVFCSLFTALQFTRLELLEVYKKLLEKLEEKEDKK